MSESMTEPTRPPQIPIADAKATPSAEGWWQTQNAIPATIYWLIHAACLLAFWTGTSAFDIALCLGLFWIRLFGITGGYHRYFSHKAFKTSRAFQFVLAILGVAAVQKGPLWWAAGHRRHHRYSDQEGDLHSPREGFWHAHQGWIFQDRWDATEVQRVRDLARYPELAWLKPLAYQRSDRARFDLFRSRRTADARLGILHLDRTPLALDLLDQLARASMGFAALRDGRRQPKQSLPRPAHPGRGLA